MRISHKLGAGFFVVIALMVMLTVVGIQRVNRIDTALEQINAVNSLKQRHAINFRGSVHDRAIALRDVVLIEDPILREQASQLIDRLTKDYAASADELAPLLDRTADMQDRQRLAAIEAVQAHVLPLIEAVRQLRAEGKVDEARSLLVDEVRPGFEQWLSAINRFIDWQEEKSRDAAQQAMSVAQTFSWLMIGATALALVLGTIVAWLLSRSVVLPLRQAVRIAERVSCGELDDSLQTMEGKPTDEAAQLLAAMAVMQRRLADVVAAQSEMARRHAAGEVSCRIDPAPFAGQYAQMVIETNVLVDGHVHTTEQLSSLIGRYAVGDFAQDMPRLPGELSVLSERMDGVKANLSALNTEISQLAKAAAYGDFAARGQEQRFENDFRQMVISLNALMQTADGNLGELSRVLRAIAAGDLTVRMAGEFHGVFAQMRDDANATAAQLAQMVEQIARSAATIDEASQHIAQDNASMSHSATVQAGDLQQAAGALEALTVTVRQTADNAIQARDLAEKAVDSAERGGEAVMNVVQTMQRIREASGHMSEVIAVIDGLAFQTNVLALNAAVEAARAGELGRGFAVVASEVRSLAQRSATSAGEVRHLIETALQQVADGTVQVDVAGNNVSGLIQDIASVNGIIARISQAAAQQSDGIMQISASVAQVEQATESSVQRMSEVVARAENLHVQGQALVTAVSRFQLQS